MNSKYRYVKLNSHFKDGETRSNFYLHNISSNYDKHSHTMSGPSDRDVRKAVNFHDIIRRRDARSCTHPHKKNGGQDATNGRYPPNKNCERNGDRNLSRNTGNTWDLSEMKNDSNLKKTLLLTQVRHNSNNIGTAATPWTLPIGKNYSHSVLRKHSDFLDSPHKSFVDFRKRKRCMMYLKKGECFRGPNCKKIHSYPKDDNIYCKFFEKGSCRLGDSCWYKHLGGYGFESQTSRKSVHQNSSLSFARNVKKLVRKGDAKTGKEISKSNGSALLENQSESQDHKGLGNTVVSEILAHHKALPLLSLGKAPKEHLSKDKNRFLNKEDKLSEAQVIDLVYEPDIPGLNATPNKPLVDLENKQPASQKTVSLMTELKDISNTEKQESSVHQRKGTSNLESSLASDLGESNFPDSGDELLLVRKVNKQIMYSPAVCPEMPRDLVEAGEGKHVKQQKRVVLQLQKTGSSNSECYLVKGSSLIQKIGTSIRETSPQKPFQRKPSGKIPCAESADESSSQPVNYNLELKLRVSSEKDASVVEDSLRSTRNMDDFGSPNATVGEASEQTLSTARDLSSRKEQLSNSCEEGKKHGDERRLLNSEASASAFKLDSENHEQEGEYGDLISHHVNNELLDNDSSIKSSIAISKSTSRKRRKSKESDIFHQKCKRFKVVSCDLLRMTLIPTDSPTDSHVSDIDENVMKRYDYRKKQRKRKHSKERSHKRSTGILKESNENSRVTYKEYKHTSKKSVTVQTDIPDADVAAVGCDNGGGLLRDNRENQSGGHHSIESSQKKRKEPTEGAKNSSLNDDIEIIEVTSTNEKGTGTYQNTIAGHDNSSYIKDPLVATGNRLIEDREPDTMKVISTNEKCTPQNIITGHIFSSDTEDTLIETGSRLSEGREPDTEKECESSGKLTQCAACEDMCSGDIKIEEIIILSSDEEELETESVSRKCNYSTIPYENDMTVVMEREDPAAENCSGAVNHIMAAVNNPSTAADHIMKAVDNIRAAAGHSKKLLNSPKAISDLIKAAMDNPGAAQEHIQAAGNNLRAAVGQPMIAVEDFHPRCTIQSHNSSVPAVSEDTEVCLEDDRTQYPTQLASISENTITNHITLPDDVICSTTRASRAENVETSLPTMHLPGTSSVSVSFDESASRVISVEAEKNLWDTFVKSEINDVNEEDYVFDSEKEKEIVYYTAQWLDGLPEFMRENDHLYDNLKRAMKKMKLEVWEQDKRIVYNWEVNLRRLAVFTLGISDPEMFTENIHVYMSEIPRLSDFVKYLTSLVSTKT